MYGQVVKDCNSKTQQPSFKQHQGRGFTTRVPLGLTTVFKSADLPEQALVMLQFQPKHPIHCALDPTEGGRMSQETNLLLPFQYFMLEHNSEPLI